MADLSIAPLFRQTAGPPDLTPINKGSVDPGKIVPITATQLRTVEGINYLEEMPKYYMRMQIGTYNRIQTGTSAPLGVSGSFNTLYNINLPLPRDLVDNQYVVYDQTPLNPKLGNALNAGLSLINNHGDSAIKNTEDMLGTLLGFAPTAVGSLLSGIKGVNAQDATQAFSNFLGIAGYTPNQFLTILLRGPQYKTYTFIWELSPKTPGESVNLAAILTLLKNAQAPQYVQGGAFFRFPKVFKLAYMPNSGFLYKFKPAVMAKLIVNYAGGGAPVFNRSFSSSASSADVTAAAADNPPAIVHVLMSFTELEFWLSGNYNNNNDPDDVHNLDEVTLAQVKAGLNSQSQTALKNSLQNFYNALTTLDPFFTQNTPINSGPPTTFTTDPGQGGGG